MQYAMRQWRVVIRQTNIRSVPNRKPCVVRIRLRERLSRDVKDARAVEAQNMDIQLRLGIDH